MPGNLTIGRLRERTAMCVQVKIPRFRSGVADDHQAGAGIIEEPRIDRFEGVVVAVLDVGRSRPDGAQRGIEKIQIVVVVRAAERIGPLQSEQKRGIDDHGIRIVPSTEVVDVAASK